MNESQTNGADVLRPFLEPMSLAVVGAPRHTGDGANVVENLGYYGFDGPVFPVNPRADEIAGLRCYPTVRDLPTAVDLALVQTSPRIVPSVVQDCADRGVKAIIIQSDGFSETGPTGRALQEEVAAIAARGGVRVLGPNTFGVINAFRNLATPFARFQLFRSPVATVSQSGMFSTGQLYELGLGKVVDLGNACDVGFHEALEYFAEDRDTRVVLLHCEEIRNARRFLEAATRVARAKPIVAIRGGKSDEGAILSRSHSGSLGASQQIIDAAFRQCGILQATDLDEMKDMARALLALPPLKGPGVAIMTLTMGGAVLLMDNCRPHGFTLSQLSVETAEQVRACLPNPQALTNPVDLMPLFIGGTEAAIESFRRVLHHLLGDRSVHAVVVISASLSAGAKELAAIMAESARQFPEKAVLSWVWGRGMDDMERAGVLNLTSAKGVASALHAARARADIR
ncbi:MAG: CoA-binding protein [Chloroflexi bacterium]|nr:CoA-binding protein [Chloroflexota bacterium]